MRQTSRRMPRTLIPTFIAPAPGRANRYGGLRPILSRLEDRTLLAIVTWTNSAGGDWDTPSNWSTGAVPAIVDDVVIDTANITVMHSGSDADAVNSLTSEASFDLSNGSLAIASTSSISGELTIDGGTLSTTENLTASGPMTWSGGTITGGGTLAARGGLRLVGPSSNLTSETLDGAVLENAGTTTLSSRYFDTTYGLVLENGAVFDNQGSGSFTFQDSGVVSGDSTSRFVNEGAITVPVSVQGTYPAVIDSPFTQTSTGSTAVEAGTLILGAGGAVGGQITVDTGATLYLGSTGSYALDSSSSISGAGNVEAIGPAVTDDGVYNISGTTVTSVGSLTFNSDATITDLGSDLVVSTSSLNIASNQSFDLTTLVINGGTLNGGGSGALLVTGSMTWDEGTVSGFETLTISSQATLTLGDVNDDAPTDLLVGLTLNNFGTAIWESSGYSTNLNGVDGAAFNNEPGASLDLQLAGGNLDGVTLNNYGTITWSTGAFGVDAGTVFNNEPGAILSTQCEGEPGSGGTLNNLPGAKIVVSNDDLVGGLGMGEIVNNDGDIEVDSGVLTLGLFYGNGGTATSSGTFYGAPGTQLGFAFPENLTPTSNINAGVVVFDSYYNQGVNDIAGTYTAFDRTVLTDTTVNFTGTVTGVGNALILEFPNATANFSPATPRTLTIPTCTIGDACNLTGTDDFVITGGLSWSGGALSTTGTTDAEGGMTITGSSSLEYGTLNNHGLATLTSAGLVTLYVSDNAIFNNLANATFDMEAPTVGVSYSGSSNGAFNNAGTLVSNPGATGESYFQVPFTNTGSVDVHSGLLDPVYFPSANLGTVTVDPGATFSPFNYTQSAGATILNNGTVGGGSITVNGGSLSGSGVINTRVTNAGQVIPGGTGSAGALTINGSYTQTAAGALDVELGGATVSAEYDQLVVAGGVSLAGALNVTTINGFQPALGDLFQILRFGSSSGNFATYNAPNLGAGRFLDPAINSMSVTLNTDLVAISGAPTFPSVGIPVSLTGSVTGPGAANGFSFAWTVTQGGNVYQSGSSSVFSFTPNLNATYLVTLAVADTTGGRGTVSVQIVVAPSVFILDGTAVGALTLSGNASIALAKISGSVLVDSASTSAISAGGNASITASSIRVVGKVQKSGNATFSPAPTTGVLSIPDPLAGLPSPGTINVTSHGSEVLSGNSAATIDPGLYSQITVSGNAKLTLNGGTYIIEGGGLTVSGNASVTGTGVTIYNAGSNYPNSGGNFGGITLSGNGTFNMSAPTTGTYAGILIFQSRQNTRALSFSGNAMLGMTGTIYAPSALLSMSGNAQLQNPLIVDMLNLSGNVGLTQTAAGSDGSGDISGIANTLLAGNLSVYINDPGGKFSTDELARIQDADRRVGRNPGAVQRHDHRSQRPEPSQRHHRHRHLERVRRHGERRAGLLQRAKQ